MCVRGLKTFRSLVVKHADTRMKNAENRHNGFCICVFYHQRLWIGGSGILTGEVRIFCRPLILRVIRQILKICSILSGGGVYFQVEYIMEG